MPQAYLNPVSTIKTLMSQGKGTHTLNTKGTMMKHYTKTRMVQGQIQVFTPVEERKRKYGNRYPWAEWFKHRKFRLTKGIHYHFRSYTFADMVRNAAVPSRYNKLVSIEVDPHDRFIIVRVRERDEKAPPRKKRKTYTIKK